MTPLPLFMLPDGTLVTLVPAAPNGMAQPSAFPPVDSHFFLPPISPALESAPPPTFQITQSSPLFPFAPLTLAALGPPPAVAMSPRVRPSPTPPPTAAPPPTPPPSRTRPSALRAAVAASPLPLPPAPAPPEAPLPPSAPLPPAGPRGGGAVAAPRQRSLSSPPATPWPASSSEQLECRAAGIQPPSSSQSQPLNSQGITSVPSRSPPAAAPRVTQNGFGSMAKALSPALPPHSSPPQQTLAMLDAGMSLLSTKAQPEVHPLAGGPVATSSPHRGDGASALASPAAPVLCVAEPPREPGTPAVQAGGAVVAPPRSMVVAAADSSGLPPGISSPQAYPSSPRSASGGGRGDRLAGSPNRPQAAKLLLASPPVVLPPVSSPSPTPPPPPQPASVPTHAPPLTRSPLSHSVAPQATGSLIPPVSPLSSPSTAQPPPAPLMPPSPPPPLPPQLPQPLPPNSALPSSPLRHSAAIATAAATIAQSPRQVAPLAAPAADCRMATVAPTLSPRLPPLSVAYTAPVAVPAVLATPPPTGTEAQRRRPELQSPPKHTTSPPTTSELVLPQKADGPKVPCVCCDAAEALPHPAPTLSSPLPPPLPHPPSPPAHPSAWAPPQVPPPPLPQAPLGGVGTRQRPQPSARRYARNSDAAELGEADNGDMAIRAASPRAATPTAPPPGRDNARRAGARVSGARVSDSDSQGGDSQALLARDCWMAALGAAAAALMRPLSASAAAHSFGVDLGLRRRPRRAHSRPTRADDDVGDPAQGARAGEGSDDAVGGGAGSEGTTDDGSGSRSASPSPSSASSGKSWHSENWTRAPSAAACVSSGGGDGTLPITPRAPSAAAPFSPYSFPPTPAGDTPHGAEAADVIAQRAAQAAAAMWARLRDGLLWTPSLMQGAATRVQPRANYGAQLHASSPPHPTGSSRRRNAVGKAQASVDPDSTASSAPSSPAQRHSPQRAGALAEENTHQDGADTVGGHGELRRGARRNRRSAHSSGDVAAATVDKSRTSSARNNAEADTQQHPDTSRREDGAALSLHDASVCAALGTCVVALTTFACSAQDACGELAPSSAHFDSPRSAGQARVEPDEGTTDSHTSPPPRALSAALVADVALERVLARRAHFPQRRVHRHMPRAHVLPQAAPQARPPNAAALTLGMMAGRLDQRAVFAALLRQRQQLLRRQQLQQQQLKEQAATEQPQAEAASGEAVPGEMSVPCTTGNDGAVVPDTAEEAAAPGCDNVAPKNDSQGTPDPNGTTPAPTTEPAPVTEPQPSPAPPLDPGNLAGVAGSSPVSADELARQLEQLRAFQREHLARLAELRALQRAQQDLAARPAAAESGNHGAQERTEATRANKGAAASEGGSGGAGTASGGGSVGARSVTIENPISEECARRAVITRAAQCPSPPTQPPPLLGAAARPLATRRPPLQPPNSPRPFGAQAAGRRTDLPRPASASPHPSMLAAFAAHPAPLPISPPGAIGAPTPSPAPRVAAGAGAGATPLPPQLATQLATVRLRHARPRSASATSLAPRASSAGSSSGSSPGSAGAAELRFTPLPLPAGPVLADAGTASEPLSARGRPMAADGVSQPSARSVLSARPSAVPLPSLGPPTRSCSRGERTENTRRTESAQLAQPARTSQLLEHVTFNMTLQVVVVCTMDMQHLRASRQPRTLASRSTSRRSSALCSRRALSTRRPRPRRRASTSPSSRPRALLRWRLAPRRPAQLPPPLQHLRPRILPRHLRRAAVVLRQPGPPHRPSRLRARRPPHPAPPAPPRCPQAAHTTRLSRQPAGAHLPSRLLRDASRSPSPAPRRPSHTFPSRRPPAAAPTSSSAGQWRQAGAVAVAAAAA